MGFESATDTSECGHTAPLDIWVRTWSNPIAWAHIHCGSIRDDPIETAACLEDMNDSWRQWIAAYAIGRQLGRFQQL